jgi:hypothetical protein
MQSAAIEILDMTNFVMLEKDIRLAKKGDANLYENTNQKRNI